AVDSGLDRAGARAEQLEGRVAVARVQRHRARDLGARHRGPAGTRGDRDGDAIVVVVDADGLTAGAETDREGRDSRGGILRSGERQGERAGVVDDEGDAAAAGELPGISPRLEGRG